MYIYSQGHPLISNLNSIYYLNFKVLTMDASIQPIPTCVLANKRFYIGSQSLEPGCFILNINNAISSELASWHMVLELPQYKEIGSKSVTTKPVLDLAVQLQFFQNFTQSKFKNLSLYSQRLKVYCLSFLH